MKAVGGGGGRGMKRVDRLSDLSAAVELASAEAGAAFGDARVYLERFVASGRHVEVQVLGDGEGNVIHLGERDCSVQRRYQKLIEETPAPGLPRELRNSLLEAGVRFAKRLSYRGAGTVEFLVDVTRGAFYFLEMNARIQVEHPVTEAVTGIDLVAEQIAVANGDGLQLEAVRHSPERLRHRVPGECGRSRCTISAQRRALVKDVSWSGGEGIRVDTHIAPGSRVPPFYDSLMAKIIAHGPTRAAALDAPAQAPSRRRTSAA